MHLKCREDWNKERCPVCNEAIGEVSAMNSREIEEQYGDRIYRPGESIQSHETPEDVLKMRKELEQILDDHNKKEPGD